MSDFFDILATRPLEFDQPGQIPGAPRIRAGRPKSGRESKKRRKDLKEYLRDLFQQYQLSPYLADWAMTVIIDGASNSELTQRLYRRPEFRERFKPMFDRQKMNKPPISPQDVVQYEKQGAQLMRSAGMPPQFYDHYTDFQRLLVDDISINELADRVNEGYEKVATGPGSVRRAFENFFGPSGDAALASMFLDPKKALPALRLQVQAAGVAGAGFNFGFTLDRSRAMDVAAAGFDFDSALDRWTNLVQTRPLFDETMGEAARGQDLTVQEEGVSAIFGLEGAGQGLESIERRRKERTAAFGGGGGAQSSQQGAASGLATAT